MHRPSFFGLCFPSWFCVHQSTGKSRSMLEFNDCKSAPHRTIQVNHQPDVTIFQFIILKFTYSSTCFGRFPAHHQELSDCSGSLWFYLRIVVTVVLCSWSGRPLEFRRCKGCKILVFRGRCPLLYSHAPHNDVSVNDGPHIRRWSCKIIIL